MSSPSNTCMHPFYLCAPTRACPTYPYAFPCMYVPKFFFPNHSKLLTTPLLSTRVYYLARICPPPPTRAHPPVHTPPICICPLAYMCPSFPLQIIPSSSPLPSPSHPPNPYAPPCSYTPKFPFSNHSRFITTLFPPTCAYHLGYVCALVGSVCALLGFVCQFFKYELAIMAIMWQLRGRHCG
jgi:hypothetical protein